MASILGRFDYSIAVEVATLRTLVQQLDATLPAEVAALTAVVQQLEARVAELEAGAIDTTPPTVTSFVIPATSDSLTVPISTLTASESATFIVQESATVPASDDARWGSAPAEFVFAAEGAKTLYAFARDLMFRVCLAGVAADVTVTITPPMVETPTASPAAGTFTADQTVTLSCATDGAAIHYTTDGSAPTAESPTYSDPIAVTATTTIRAMATHAAMNDSAALSATYTLQCAAPTFDPAAGTYETTQTVTIETTTSGATIRYTVDGSAPSGSSALYSAPISVTATALVRAIAIKSGYANSAIGSVSYTIGAGSPMTTAHLTSGVAPLAVFFDAVDDTARTWASDGETTFAWTSGVVQPVDKEATHYSWDFGDGTAGTWTQTGKSRNTATGYVAAHVYETPGTFIATLTVTEPDGSQHTYTQTITVSAFAGSSYYAAATPAGAANGADAANAGSLANGWTWLNAVSGRRLLLKRGDTFTSAGLTTTTARNDCHLGAYGEGVKPQITITGLDNGIKIRSNGWRVMDVVLVGPGGTTAGAGNQGYGFGLDSGGTYSNNLVLRCEADGFRASFGNDQYFSFSANPCDGNVWMECEAGARTPQTHTNHMYFGGRRTAVLGMYLHDQPLSHLMRTPELHKGVVSNCKLWNPGTDRGALKLGGRAYGLDSNGVNWPYTRWVAVSDNDMKGVGYTTSIGPQNTAEDERMSHIVLERNHFRCNPTHPGYPGVSAHITVEAHDVMVRNNVFDLTNAYGKSKAVYLQTMHVGAPPDAGTQTVRILNNTVVQRTSPGGDNAVYVATFQNGGGEDIVDVTIRNNIIHAPLTGTVALRELEDGRTTEGTGYAAGTNLIDPAVSPFTDLAAEDYTLAAGSDALGAGTALAAVREDFARNTRPASPDIGAHEAA